MGRPKLNSKWSEAEAEAFARFTTPDRLAVALYRRGEEGAAARKAITDISHTAKHLSGWLQSADYLEANRDRIAFIAHLPDLDRDLARLRHAIGVTDDFQLPSDPLARHGTPEGFETTLSPAGEANIRAWYRDDAPIIEWCMAFRKEMIPPD